jgi:hypothetical protein
MKRIRYKNTKEEGVVVSNKILKSERTGAEYLVYLDLENVTYKIKNINSENVHRGGENINNLNVLKRSVKTRLEGMGVRFEDEERFRSFGRCPKGMTQQKWMDINKYEI